MSSYWPTFTFCLNCIVMSANPRSHWAGSSPHHRHPTFIFCTKMFSICRRLHYWHNNAQKCIASPSLPRNNQ